MTVTRLDVERSEYEQQIAALQQENERLKEQVAKYKSFAEDQDNMLNELDRHRALLRELADALKGLQQHCAEKGWWLESHAVDVMVKARAALARAEEVLGAQP